MPRTLTLLYCLMLALPAYAGEASQAVYEILLADSSGEAVALIAKADTRADNIPCPPGGSGYGCMTVDGKVRDYGRAAGFEFVTHLVHNGRGMVAGHGSEGGWQRVKNAWHRWYYVHFVKEVPEHPLGYLFPLRRVFVHDGHRVLKVEGLGGTDTTVNAINASGHVVGASETRSGHFHAYLHRDGRTVNLGTLGGGFSHAIDINDQGDIVGVATNAAGEERAFLYRQGRMLDLNRLVASSSWRLVDAYYIDDRGHIVASGIDGSGKTQPVVLRRRDGS